jgi:hypothetical protein
MMKLPCGSKPRDRECIWADPPLDLRPRHRRGEREAFPRARGIGADRRRAASIAQIIDIDALVALSCGERSSRNFRVPSELRGHDAQPRL